jgi:hypothetical protein
MPLFYMTIAGLLVLSCSLMFFVIQADERCKYDQS